MNSATLAVAESRTNRMIFRAAASVMAATVLVKALGLAKEFVVAAAFGRSDEVEAFLIAVLIPGLLINLIAESTNQALIPTLVRVRVLEGREHARRLFSNVMWWSLLLLVGSSVAMALGAHGLLAVTGSHFSPAKLNLAVKLFYGVLPVIALTGVASMCTAVLNTEGDFAGPAISPAVTSLLIIVVVPLFARSAGAWSMVYATVAGALVHASWMTWRTSRSGYRIDRQCFAVTAEAIQVARQFGPLMLSGVVASGGLLVDQAMAATLAGGSVAALAYAGRFVSVALALMGSTVSSALTPAFAEMAAKGDWDECRRTMRVWAWGSGAVATAAAGLLIACSGMVIQITLQHGSFKAEDSAAVARVLTMYAMQIPFFVSSRVFYRFLIAARRTQIVFYCGALNLALDIILNVVLMRWLGVAGIALATSLWAVSTLMFLAYWSRRVLAEVIQRASASAKLEG